MKRVFGNTLIGVVLAVMGSTASAQMYVGADLTSTRVDGYTSAGGHGIFAGYQFTPNWAAEVSYRNLGKFESDNASGYTRLNMTQISAVGMMPLNEKFKVYARLGWGFANATGSKSYNAANSMGFGAGAEYSFSKNLGVRAEINSVATDAKQFNVGMLYRF